MQQMRRYSIILYPRSTGDDSMTTGCALTSETTLGEVRSKIVLLRRFEVSQDVGTDLTYWPPMDYFEKHPELVSNVIKVNQKIG